MFLILYMAVLFRATPPHLGESVGDTLDNYGDLIDQLLLLSTPRPSTYPDMWLAIQTPQWTTPSPAKGELELTPQSQT